MKKTAWVVLIITCLAFSIAGCSFGTKALKERSELTVSAAISLKDVLEEARNIYQAKHPNVSITYNFGASGSLSRQIIAGAPVDLFIAAADRQMSELQAAGLADNESRSIIARNRLVIIVPAVSTVPCNGIEDLANSDLARVAIGAPDIVPAGQYAKQALEQVHLADKVLAKAVLAKDVRTVVSYVEGANVDAGLVYRTDAEQNTKVRIVSIVPENLHAPIVYPAAVVTTSRQNVLAKEFLSFLTSQDGQEIFKKWGFDN